MIEILFPVSGDYDRDDDGLLDFEVRFLDAGSGIDSSTLEIASSRALGPLGQGGTDLLGGFQTIQRNDSLAVLEETTNALLPDGSVDLIVRVSDQLGNPAEERITVNLPSGDFHRYMSAGPQGPDFERFGIEMLPDGSKGYLLGQTGHDIVPFDPFLLTYETPISVPAGFNRFLPDGVYDPATRRLYLIDTTLPEILVLDPAIDQFEAPIPINSRGGALELGPSGLIYASLSARTASVAVIDPARREQIKLIELPYEAQPPNDTAFIGAARVPSEEDRLYVILRVGPGGVGVFNFDGVQLDWIDLNPNSAHPGFGNQSVIDRIANRLYVTDTQQPGGLIEVDLSSNSVTRELRMFGLGGRNVAISPTQSRVLVTLGGDPGVEPENWLVDLLAMTILNHLPSVMNVDRPGDQKGVFRPDGQLFFIVSGNGISVYLNRE